MRLLKKLKNIPWFKALRPILALPIFVLANLAIDEEYPFSDFPMYSAPGPEPTFYLYLGNPDILDENGYPSPVPIEYATSIRAAMAKKDYEKIRGKGNTPSDRERAGLKLITQLRKRATEMERTGRLPERLAIMHVEVSIRAGEGIREIPSLLVAEP